MTISHDAIAAEAAPESPTESRDTYLWHSQAHMPSVRRSEIVLVRGEGAYLWDEDGRRLLDAPASLWYCNVGHGRAEIADAVAAQMRTLETYSTFQRYATRPALEVAERVAGLVPIESPRVFLTSGGGDSVDAAVKLVRRYWSAVGRSEKRTIVTRDLAYHGLHGFGTSITGIAANRDGLGVLAPDTMLVATSDLDALADLFERERDSIAAFFCEPVIGTGGVIPVAAEYLTGAQQLCRDHDIAFVVDEVITGFGRTGAMFASERFGLSPDVLLIAKGITSGYLPLGGMVVGERLWAPFWEDGSELVFRHGLTYAGHASVCAAAMANLDIIEREGLVQRVLELEPVLERLLRPLAAHPLVHEVRGGVGLLGGVQIVDAATAEQVAAECVENGVLMRVITNGTLQISPPFVVTEEDLVVLADVIASALDTVAAL